MTALHHESWMPAEFWLSLRRFPTPGLVIGLCLAVAAFGASGDALWFDDGRPKDAARQAIEALLSASADGLDPDDYEAGALARTIAETESGRTLPAGAQAVLDRQLTEAMSLYLSDIHFGRVDPRELHANLVTAPPDGFDPDSNLRVAVAGHRLPEAIREAEPAIPIYPALRQALVRYRTLARNRAVATAWEASMPAFPGRKLEPGMEYKGAKLLARRLYLLDDLNSDTVPGKRYEGVLVEGIKSFQRRHGLEPDGVIGNGTLAQLNVSPAERVRQIELAMERLRWIPRPLAQRIIVINIPEFWLRAYENQNDQPEIKVAMKVIVGKAMKTQTPLIKEEMRFIEFSPYWNVPPSIASEEIIPRLRHDPAYFRQQGLEFVKGNARVVADLSDANLRAVLGGKMRIRQRPGPKNPLGGIKFIFPNNDNIYLHDTPAPTLFHRDRRDLSHGCIRVQDPIALAKYVLTNDAEWPEERIREAMTQKESKMLPLDAPLPVVITYITAIARGDGRVYFFPDIYGHDRSLDVALRQRSRVLRILR